MEFVTVDIQTTKSLLGLPYPERLLMPIGDTQCGVPACDEDRLKRHIDWGMQHSAVFVGAGDYVDMASPSDRKRLKAGDFYDSVTKAILDKAEADVERFLELVKGTEHQWLGLVSGHHYMEFPDGSTSDTRIAKGLGCTFLGDSATVRVRLCDASGPLATVDVLVAHGKGTTSSEAAALNAVMKWGNGFGHHDVVLNGHHHKKVATKKPRPYWNEAGELKHRNTLYAVTGAFLKGYMEGSKAGAHAGGGYVEKAMYSPVTLGGLVIYMRAKPDGTPDLDVSL